MGRTKVRMHLRTTDAQAVWKEYSEYMTTACKGASEKRKLTQYVTNTVLPCACAIRPRTLKNPNQRLVATGGGDHQPHPRTMEHPTSPTDDGTPTMPDQRLVGAGGEEDHQPDPKTMEHPTSPTDDGTPTMPDQRLVAGRGEEDHQPHSKTLKHPSSSMDDGTPNEPDIPTVFIESRHDDGQTSTKPLPEFNPDDLIGRTFLLPPGDNGERLRAKVTRKVVEVIKKADGERVQNLSYILGCCFQMVH